MELRYKVMGTAGERAAVIDGERHEIASYAKDPNEARVIAAIHEWADFIDAQIGDIDDDDFLEELTVNTLGFPLPSSNDVDRDMAQFDEFETFALLLLPQALRLIADRMEIRFKAQDGRALLDSFLTKQMSLS